MVEQSVVESESARKRQESARSEYHFIAEANSMNIHLLGTYLILSCSWEPSEQCPNNRIEIGRLVVEESGIESKGARKSLSSYC